MWLTTCTMEFINNLVLRVIIVRVQDADEKLLQMTTGKAAELVSTVCVCVCVVAEW